MAILDSGNRYSFLSFSWNAPSPTSNGPNRPMNMQRIMASLPKLVRFAERLNTSPLPTEYPVVPKADATSNMSERKEWGSTMDNRRVNTVNKNMARIANARAL